MKVGIGVGLPYLQQGSSVLNVMAPTANWLFQEATGSTRIDNTATPNNLTDHNTINTVSGFAGLSAAQPSAANSYGEKTPVTAKLQWGSGSWAGGFWVFLPTGWSSTAKVWDFGDEITAGWTIAINNVGPTFSFLRSTGSASAVIATSTANLNTNAWNWCGFKYDGAKIYLKVNGESWETGVTMAVPIASTDMALVGDGASAVTTTKLFGMTWWLAYNPTDVETALIVAHQGYWNGTSWVKTV